MRSGPSVADLDNATKQMLEAIFEMSGGYLLDFSNATFRELRTDGDRH